MEDHKLLSKIQQRGLPSTMMLSSVSNDWPLATANGKAIIWSQQSVKPSNQSFQRTGKSARR